MQSFQNTAFGMNQLQQWKPFFPRHGNAIQIAGNFVPGQIPGHFPGQLTSRNYYAYYHRPTDIYRHRQECEGLENLLKDIELVALLLGILSLFKGIFSLVGSTFAILFNKFNVAVAGIPSRILGILRFLGVDVPVAIENTVLALELVFTSMEIGFWIPFEQFNNFIHLLGESLAVVSLSLAFITAFDDLWKDDLESVIGRRAFRFIQSYGCIPGFDAEAVVRNIFGL